MGLPGIDAYPSELSQGARMPYGGRLYSPLAPDNENDTSAYISSVCSQLGVSGAYVPDVGNRDTMCAFAAAISRHENGVNAHMEEVQDGWDLL